MIANFVLVLNEKFSNKKKSSPLLFIFIHSTWPKNALCCLDFCGMDNFSFGTMQNLITPILFWLATK
jgi:hypothetical protein